jgi:hypothetical protein
MRGRCSGSAAEVAELVLAAALSHGPLLATPPEQWTIRADADRRATRLWFRGAPMAFDDLLTMRTADVDDFTAASSEGERVRRHGDCQRALDALAQHFHEASVDLAIVVGNDQREMFGDDVRPALLVLGAPSIPNVPLDDDERAALPPGVALAEEGHCPPEGAVYPGQPAAARTILRVLLDRGVDAAWSGEFPTRGPQRGIPHAFGFVYRRVMRDAPPPTVPFVINAGIEPNRPTALRCFDYGDALVDAVAALPDSMRVAVIASGGLSHFVVDEQLDDEIMGSIRSGDLARWRKIDEAMYEGNSGEIKNWIPAASAASRAGLGVAQCDYVACYRTEAGTGSGMGFVTWR